jgi:heme/copper-type cytochrome/quinol oxidase subunit 4
MNVKRGLDRLLIYLSVLYFIGAATVAAVWTQLAGFAPLKPPPYSNFAETLTVAAAIFGGATIIYILVYGLIWVLYGLFEWNLPRIDKTLRSHS